MRLQKALAAMGCIGIAVLLGASCARQGDDDKTLIRVASVLPADHPSSRALAFFEERLEALSGGTVDVRLFLNGQLGDDVETAEMCQMGNIEAFFISSATMSQFAPLLNALSMPFIFRDDAHLHTVLDGPVRGLLREELQKLDFDILAFFDAGSRNVMTKQGPVRTPDDLVGKKIRVMGSPLMVDSINALGASAISMGQGEVYTALQTGVIDGWENNPQTALVFRMHETGCKHFAHTRHLMIPDMLIMSRGFYAQLTPEIRAWVDQAAREAEARQRELWRESDDEAIAKLKAAGMTFNGVDIAPFKDKVGPVYERYFKQYGSAFQALCERIMETE